MIALSLQRSPLPAREAQWAERPDGRRVIQAKRVRHLM